MSRYVVPILLCLTLGLAPFTPEPHLVGKLRWVVGGGVGMGPMDVFDLLLHASPFVLLLGVAIHHVWSLQRSQGGSPGAGS